MLLDNTLRIEDARPEDQGRYICQAHNEGGNVSVAVKLYVYGKFLFFFFLSTTPFIGKYFLFFVLPITS